MALIELWIEFSLRYHQFIALRTVVYKLRVQNKFRLVIPVFFYYLQLYNWFYIWQTSEKNFAYISRVRNVLDAPVLLTNLGYWASVPYQQVWFEWWFHGLSKGIHDCHTRFYKGWPSDFISALGYKWYITHNKL